MKQILLLTSLLLITVGAQAQNSQWVAYNDHFRGPNTAPNVSSWNIANVTPGSPGNSGPMTNFLTGVELPVTMSVTSLVTGFTTGTGSSGPQTGTPASIMFTNIIDWANGTLGHAVQLAVASKIVHAFGGLDPAKRYSWHGSAARGGNTQNRWTLLEIGAAAWVDAHSTLTATGVFTTAQIPSLTSSQAVALFSENRSLGVVAGWTNIQPNADGSILIYQTTYRGALPPGLTFDTGNYGYATVADRLEEFTTGADTCVGIIAQSGNISVAERGLATFSISATGTPQTIRWFRSDNGGANYSLIPGASGSTYSIPSVVVGDNNARFFATVSNSVCNVSSAVKILTVVPDTTAPAALSAVLGTNLTTATISFSEAINPGIDTSSFSVFATGTQPENGTIADTATVTDGTNIVITVAPGSLTAGVNYSVQILDIYDTAATPNVILPYPTTIPLQQTVILFTFDKTWRYDQSGTDLGTAWKEINFNDSAWPSGPGVLGFETTANVITFLTSIAPPFGTNTILTLTNNTGAGIGGTNVTFYFRTAVNIPDFNPALATMRMRAYSDDGSILYVNGIDRFHYNMPAAPNYTNFSTANLAEGVLVVSNLTGFIQGNNLLAVEVHQDAIGSSDIDWGMQLEALVTTFGPSGPTLTPSLNGNALTITWNGGGTFQKSSNLSSPANWTTIPGAASPFVTNTTAANALFFRVIVP